jgi:tRNA(Ile)-lysidine synthase
MLALEPLLHTLAPWRHAPAWHVAFSGGLDSTVLLHALAALARQHTVPPLHAIHVHHGLQAAADAWPAHCQAICQGLGVPLHVAYVRVGQQASLEDAARQARYALFEQQLAPGELLLTAQHRDDQAETLLFRLLRGAGVRGLAGMPQQRRLGQGTLLRPLLGVPRDALLAYANTHGLQWVEDPSNSDQQFTRNYLRQQVFPLLAGRWPQASANMARAAGHLSEALGLLEELAAEDLAGASADATFAWLQLPALRLPPLQALSPARQRNALQAWLAPLSRLPDSQHWAGWESLRDAGPDAAPAWVLGDGEMRRAAGELWWLAGDWLRQPEGGQAWLDMSRPLPLPGNGEVHWQGARPEGPVQVHYRQGGETLHIAGRGRRDLKRLLNESGLPPFVRQRLPLLFVDGQLHAVANLSGMGATSGQLKWLPPTSDQRLR